MNLTETLKACEGKTIAAATIPEAHRLGATPSHGEVFSDHLRLTFTDGTVLHLENFGYDGDLTLTLEPPTL